MVGVSVGCGMAARAEVNTVKEEVKMRNGNHMQSGEAQTSTLAAPLGT